VRGNRWIQVLVLATMITCCFCSFAWAGIRDEPVRKGYQFSEHTPHLWLYWNCDEVAGNAKGIEGMVEVKGQSNSPVYNLQLKLIAFNEKGRPMRGELIAAPHKLLPSMSYRFHLSLPLKGRETDFGLRVYYRYIPAEGGAEPTASRIQYSMDFYDWTFREICSQE